MRTKRNYPVSLAVIVAVFLSGGLFAMMGANVFGVGDKTGVESRAAESVPVADALPEATTLEDAFTQVVERVNPAVVQIQAENIPTDWNPDEPQPNPFDNTPFGNFFRDFDFNGPQIPRAGLGSGVIIRPDGHILTNNHVIENMNELTVIAMDGTEYEARVIGADPVSDVAVIKIDAEALPFIGMGNSDHIKVGTVGHGFRIAYRSIAR